MKRLITGLALVSVLGISAIATAQDKGPHDGAIEARQAMFKLYGFSMGTLGAMAKGKMDYNAELAQELADNLYSAARLGQSAMWPPGSDNATPGNAPTRALPDLWANFPDVGKKGQALLAASETLKAEAGNGLDALRGVMGDVGATCKDCHDDYRAKKK